MNKHVADVPGQTQFTAGGPSLLTNEEIAAVSGGVVICYGPSPRPRGSETPYVPPGGNIP